MPRGFRQIALSISCLSPIVSWPVALLATKMASLIFLPEWRFLDLTSFQSLTRPNLSFGSSSLISLCRQPLSLSRARLRPPGNIHNRSRRRLTRSTRPRFVATSFDDFAIPYSDLKLINIQLVTSCGSRKGKSSVDLGAMPGCRETRARPVREVSLII